MYVCVCVCVCVFVCQSWELSVFSVKTVIFKTKPQVPSSKISLQMGKDH